MQNLNKSNFNAITEVVFINYWRNISQQRSLFYKKLVAPK
jgi:hypothetical protein